MENRTIREQYQELAKSLEFHVAKIEKLEEEKIALKKEVALLTKVLGETNKHVDEIHEDLATAINQVDDLEQYTRKHNLQIHGIAEHSDENVGDHIIKLGNVLNVKITKNDIDICHRMPTSKNNTQPRPIIVRFKSYRVKQELYAARKHLKNLSLDQFFQGTGIVYITENLTRMRRELFSKVWKKKKQLNWHSAWTIDGKIFIRKSAEDRPARIYNVDDLV